MLMEALCHQIRTTILRYQTDALLTRISSDAKVQSMVDIYIGQSKPERRNPVLRIESIPTVPSSKVRCARSRDMARARCMGR
jgi:hypothetical protein